MTNLTLSHKEACALSALLDDKGVALPSELYALRSLLAYKTSRFAAQYQHYLEHLFIHGVPPEPYPRRGGQAMMYGRDNPANFAIKFGTKPNTVHDFVTNDLADYEVKLAAALTRSKPIDPNIKIKFTPITETPVP